MISFGPRAVSIAAERLTEAGLDAREAWQLAEAAGDDEARLAALVQERLHGAPLALLLGRQRFMDLDLLTGPGVLVPRPETEQLAGAAIERLAAAAGEGRAPRFLDLCCGSGNLACALAARVPSARGFACDLTEAATALARRNLARVGVADRVEVLQGDLLDPLGGRGLEGGLDLIVCNPPYISTSRLGKDRAQLLDHEPREAFDGGPYGLSIHQRVAREAPALLRPGAPLLLEVGAGQDRQVALVLKRAGAWQEPVVYPDAEGVGRVIIAHRKGD